MKKELVSNLNVYLANVGLSYIKLHNLHWNVVGKQFKATHEYLETLYDAMANVLDEVAELLKMNGETPLGSLKDYLEVTTLKEIDNKEVGVETTLKIVLDDMKQLKEETSFIRQVALVDDHFDVVNKMEDDIANYNKTIWFLESTLKCIQTK